MHKLINRIVLIMIVLGAGYYFIQEEIDSPAACKEAAGVWNEGREHCEQSTQQKIYAALASDSPITMTYPGKSLQVKIDKVEKINEISYLRGHYQKLLEEAIGDKEAVYDRGSLYLNMSKMVIVNESISELIHYTTPFLVNTAGSSVFVYVGLFSYDMKTKQSEHLDSILLGERVRRETITPIKDYLQVDYKEHAEGQDFLEFPSEARVKYLQLINDFSTFETIQRMHSSWDENNDGINDCESDESCDHTIDYTLPRPEEI